jgi:hypothetical protein
MAMAEDLISAIHAKDATKVAEVLERMQEIDNALDAKEE